MLKNKNTLKLLRWGGKLKLKDKKKDKKKKQFTDFCIFPGLI